MTTQRKRTVNLSSANWQFCEKLMQTTGHFDSVEDAANYLLNSMALNTSPKLPQNSPNHPEVSTKVQEDSQKIQKSAKITPTEEAGGGGYETWDLNDI